MRSRLVSKHSDGAFGGTLLWPVIEEALSQHALAIL